MNACPADTWTKTGRNVLFEIKSFKSEAYDFSDRILVAMILGPADPALREHFFASARSKPSLFVGGTATIGKQYATLFSKELLSKNAAKNMDEEQKTVALNSAWSEFVARDLPKLTEEMLEFARSAPVRG